MAANTADVAAAARIYYYYQQQGNLAAALRALYEYRQRKDSHTSTYTPDELFPLAPLFEGAHNYDEPARSYYGLCNRTPAGAPAPARHALPGSTRPGLPTRWATRRTLRAARAPWPTSARCAIRHAPATVVAGSPVLRP